MAKLRFRTKSALSTVSSETLGKTNRTELVVVLHGLLQSLGKMRDVVDAIQEYVDDPDIWTPKLPYRNPLRPDKPVRIIERLCHDLDTIWKAGAYKSLRIVGHSMGGVYGRALLLEGRRRRSPWADGAVCSRFVMLAAVNSGFSVSHHMRPSRAIVAKVVLMIGGLMRLVGLTPVLFSATSGAAFLTRMRLRWLDEESKACLGEAPPFPAMVQLLGSIDDVVGPKDSLDLITGRTFRYLDVDNTGHLSVVQMGRRGRSITEDESHRRKVFRLALTGDPDDDIAAAEVRPWELREPTEAEARRRRAIKHVVFIVHGIRDEGYWTDKVARRIWDKADEETRASLDKMVESYGYFGMGPFLLPWQRQKKVAWLMERYLEMRALYPEAEFSYIGHSHGTYIVARALELYELCRFRSIIFAGSIVREEYDWPKLIDKEPKQVSHVLNIAATSDFVVAWFPRFFNMYNLQDLGGAGHNGFTKTTHGKVHPARFVRGGHSAGRQEALWDGIAQFVLNPGKGSPFQTGNPSSKPSKGQRFVRDRLRLPWAAIVWLLSWANILVWVSLAVLLLVVVPIILLAIWPWVADQLTQLGALVPHPWVLRISIALGAALYFGLAIKQGAGRRRLWGLRSFVAFPLALLAGGAYALVLTRPIVGGAEKLLGSELVWLQPEAWLPGVYVLWAFSLLWLLRRV